MRNVQGGQAFDFDELPGDCKRIIMRDYKYGLRYRMCMRELKNAVYNTSEYGYASNLLEYLRVRKEEASAYRYIRMREEEYETAAEWGTWG